MLIAGSDAQPADAARSALALRIRRGVRFVVLVAIAWVLLLLCGAIAVGDRSALSRLERAGPSIATLMALAFVANYVFRFARWHWMFVMLGERVPKLAGFAIFMAGLGLLPTPGKIGVAARSLLLEQYGVPFRASIAAYFAERLFDLVGLLLLTAIFYRGPSSTFLAAMSLAAVLLIVFVSRFPDPIVRILAVPMRGFPKLAGALDAFRALLRAMGRLLRLPQALAFTLLGLIANVILGLLLWGVLADLSAPVSPETAIGALALAHLTGSVSMVPGGIGGFEVALLLNLDHAGVAADEALIALACLRLVTLWGAVVVGLPLMVAGMREDRLARKNRR